MEQFAKFKWTLFALLSAVVVFAYLVSNYLLHLKKLAIPGCLEICKSLAQKL